MLFELNSARRCALARLVVRLLPFRIRVHVALRIGREVRVTVRLEAFSYFSANPLEVEISSAASGGVRVLGSYT